MQKNALNGMHNAATITYAFTRFVIVSEENKNIIVVRIKYMKWWISYGQFAKWKHEV